MYSSVPASQYAPHTEGYSAYAAFTPAAYQNSTHTYNSLYSPYATTRDAVYPSYATQVVQHNPYSQPVFQHFDYARVASLSPIRSPQKGPATTSPGARHNTAAATVSAPHEASPPVSTADLLLHAGQFEALARTPTGSSFIQSALKEGCDPANVTLVWSELESCFVDLLLDAHGCYVLKSLMERMDEALLSRVIQMIVRDEQLCFSMCTHSLHTRRVAQFLIERDVTIMGNMLVRKCREIGMTQQGCIIMQKAMDVAQQPLRAMLFDAVVGNFVDFALDPFANYIVQHLLELNAPDVPTDAIVRAVEGRVCTLSCNKYASNVVEKCLFHLSSEAQHRIIQEMYNVDEEVLFQMLQDSFGNYIIQSSIALANFRDIWMISEKLKAVLQRTPYGHKIEARLERRLKGKSVLSRGKPQQHGGGSRGRQSHRSTRSEFAATQEPW